MVRDVSRVDRVAVATRAGVEPNLHTLFGGESVEDLIVQVHKRLKKILVRPGVSRIFLSRQACIFVSASFHPGSYSTNSRPSVKSMETLLAPAAKHPRISFSHSPTRSCVNCCLL